MHLGKHLLRLALAVAFCFAIAAIEAPHLYAQGCVVAHSVGEVGGPDSDGGYLGAGKFQFNLEYRHLYSFRQ